MAKQDVIYPAPHFIEEDQKLLKQFISAFPLASLICVQDAEIYTSYLPLIWKGSNKLIGHLDVQNPQVKLLQNSKEVKAIFHGPENYISPSHFKTNELPTYNYCKVEVNGLVNPISSTSLKEAIIELTTQLEGKEAAYELNHSEDRLHHLVKYIYGFEIEITNLQGRFKMSQDKTKEHQEFALRNLELNLLKRHQKFLKQYWTLAKDKR